MTHSIPDAAARRAHDRAGHGPRHRRLQVRPDAGRRHPRRRRRAWPSSASEGLLLLCGDSTNADRPGFSPSEAVVGPQPRGGLPALRGAHRRHLLRLEHPPRPAGRRRRRRARAQGLRSSGARCARTSTSAARSGHIEVPEGILVQPRELDDWPDEQARDHLDRVPGRAAERAAAHGPPRPPAGRAARGRHGRLLAPRRSRATSAPSTRRSTASTTSAAT